MRVETHDFWSPEVTEGQDLVREIFEELQPKMMSYLTGSREDDLSGIEDSIYNLPTLPSLRTSLPLLHCY